jgi:AraC family transcriptional regulator, regulatory protein of adaptative response / DNA-3-methyladenine glycosylase II
MDAEVCYRAAKARDARFDGLFFTAVRTTGIFCRPVCPVRTPLRRNVEFFPNAASARAAGYRPCLRCRPEVSPESPVSAGTSASVNRALRLINEGALDNGSSAELADRLGLTDRHLRRLFVEHVGVPPIVVAETRRLLFAKKLITETNLRFSEIAFASGFGSLRRFNEAIRATYQRNPNELRRFAPPDSNPNSAIELKLNYRPPYNWSAFLRFVSRRAIAGLETVTDRTYQRDGISVSHNATENCLLARIEPANVSRLRAVVEQIRFFFDLRANTREITGHLRKSPMLKELVARNAGLRLPGCWDPFELAVRAILGQQITVKGASTLAARLVESFGPPKPQVLADSDLTRIGLTRARSESLRALSRAVAEGQLRFDGSSATADVIAQLCELPGVGAWTANYIAMRALGDPDAFPSSDLGLLKAAHVSSARRLEEMAEAWRPWRSYAALHLWESLR